MTKLSHKQMHAERKKLRRKKIRQAAAQLRDESECNQTNPEADEELSEAREALLREMEERERERLHREWLSRETAAMEDFKNKQAKDVTLKETEKKDVGLTKQLVKQSKDTPAQIEFNKNRNKEDHQHSLTKPSEANAAWHNPLPPDNYGTELDRQNCPFFLKTGACRFGDRCSRGHLKPAISATILIPGMFSHFSIDKAWRDEYDSDINLEYEDSECYQHFKEFYEDTLSEFKKIGHVVQFKVCCNFESHLRGNVYVQYKTEEDAMKALSHFNGRWYAGRQLSCEFSFVHKWKSAICGLYHRNKCPKGRSCNFLHVFKNPNNEFWAADFDMDHNDDSDTRIPRKRSTPSYRQSSYDRSTSHRSSRHDKFRHKRSRSRSKDRHSSKDGKHKRNSSSSRNSSKHPKKRKLRLSRSRAKSNSSNESDTDKDKHRKANDKRNEKHKEEH